MGEYGFVCSRRGSVIAQGPVIRVNFCPEQSGLTNKFRSGEKKDHWLDHADDRFGEKLRMDIKAVLRVLLLFVPLPIFWALYDQQGSRWTFQVRNTPFTIASRIKQKYSSHLLPRPSSR